MEVTSTSSGTVLRWFKPKPQGTHLASLGEAQTETRADAGRAEVSRKDEAQAATESRLDGLDRDWNAETVDPSWAPSARTYIVDRSADRVRDLEMGVQLDSIDCRTTICKVQFKQRDLAGGTRFAQELPRALKGQFKRVTMFVPNAADGKIVAYVR